MLQTRAGDDFEGLDEPLVLDVKSVEGLDVRAAIGLACEGFAVPHERRREAGVTKFLVAIEAVGKREIPPLEIELRLKGEIEAAARSPEETDAEFPCRRGEYVELPEM